MGEGELDGTEKEFREKRDFARVPVHMAVRYTAVNAEEYARLLKQRETETGVSRRGLLGASFPSTPVSRREETDYDIRERLKIINDKLDYLIGLIVVGTPAREYAQSGCLIELSGSGFKIVVCSPAPAALSYLDMCLETPYFPYFIDSIYGQVKRIEAYSGQPEDAFEMAVELVDLDESVREELVQLTFEKQREFLRTRKP